MKDENDEKSIYIASKPHRLSGAMRYLKSKMVISTPAGWYTDNHDPTMERWWNGKAWTGRVRSQGKQPKSVILAIFLNFIWPGVGYVYAGVKAKFGLILAVIGCFLCLFTFATAFAGLILAFPAWILMATWSMAEVYDLMKNEENHQSS